MRAVLSPDAGLLVVHWGKYTYCDHTEKPQNDRLYERPSTKKKDVVTKRLHTQLTRSIADDISRRVTSGWHYTSLTLADHGVKVSEKYSSWSDAVTTVLVRYTSDVKWVLYLSALKCPGAQALEAINFPNCWGILKLFQHRHHSNGRTSHHTWIMLLHCVVIHY